MYLEGGLPLAYGYITPQAVLPENVIGVF